MPLAHVSLPTGKNPANFAAMREFYTAALKPLGFAPYMDRPEMFIFGLGVRGGGGGGGGGGVALAPDFWLHFGYGNRDVEEGEREREREKYLGGTHVAFAAESREKVDEWYEAAIKAGGTCNGKPGFRKEYAETYYAAFVLDPLGNNVEALHFAIPSH
ncbi:Glyoxalase/Bleomycin resistance protein/Dihydroxybiphenyl dioxygenase [Xylariaceae sp. FL0594]|nr:Glyoxalase/Bleomycin resistance protein/Dihydroxybiphenyl dioxygenase [Xylariaceae sp. FL0594]